MKRKITRKSLDELAKEMPVLSDLEQRTSFGGGDGSQSNPFRETRYLDYIASGYAQEAYVLFGGNSEATYTSSEVDGRIVNFLSPKSYNYETFEKMSAVGEWTGGWVIFRDGTKRYLDANAKDDNGIIDRTGIYIRDQMRPLHDLCMGYVMVERLRSRNSLFVITSMP